MKILFLSHRTPYPPNKGDKIRSFNVLRHLAERHEVHLVTLVDAAADVAAVAELEHRVRGGVMYARIDQPGRKLFALRAMLSHRSISVQHFYSKALQARVDELIGRESFDAVVCSSSPMAEYLFRSVHYEMRLAGVLKIMDLIDVDSYKWRQYAARASAPSALIYRYESRRLEDYERRIYREFDWVLLVSEQERGYFAGGDPLRKLVAVSNGVDLAYFNPGYTPAEPSGIPAAPTIVFTGMMDYWPNVEGMQWFIDSVFPRIRAAVPQVRLYVVGGRPSRSVLRWAESADVVVTGFVPDVRTYVAKADVCIAPLRVARGIQNKVLEAMAMGKAVVSTPEAHEGIDADPHDELLVANGELAFGDGVIALLRDPERARRLGDNARRCVERRYAWATNLRRLDDLLGARAARPAPPESIREPTIAGA